MTKKEKLKMIVDKVLIEVQEDSPIVAMLRPILTDFIAQMKDEDVDKMIKIIKAIIEYLEKEEKEEVKQEEGAKQDEEDKKVCFFGK